MSATFNDDEFCELMAALENAIAAAATAATSAAAAGAVARRIGAAGYQSATRDELARLLAGITPAPGPGPAADDAGAAELPPLKLAAAPNWAAANALRNLLMGDAMRWGQNRLPSAGTRQLVFLTLKQAATGDDVALHAFIDFVFGAVSYKDLTGGAVWALQAWLKPAGLVDGKYAAANADAAKLVAVVVAAHAIEADPPADPAPVPAHA